MFIALDSWAAIDYSKSLCKSGALFRSCWDHNDPDGCFEKWWKTPQERKTHSPDSWLIAVHSCIFLAVHKVEFSSCSRFKARGASYGCSRKDTQPWIHSSRDAGVFKPLRLVDLVDISGDGLVNYLEWLGLTAPESGWCMVDLHVWVDLHPLFFVFKSCCL